MHNGNRRITNASMARSLFSQRAGSAGEAQYFSSVERVTPVRPPTLEADVLVPGAQCLLIGAGAFCVVTVMGGAWLPLEHALILGVAAGGIGAGAMAYDAITEARRSLYSVEKLKDNLAATSTSAAQAAIETVELRVTREDLNPSHPPISIRDLPVDAERLRALAQAALADAPLTQAEWAGSDKPFSRPEFDQVMTYLTELGLVAWNSSRDNAQGRALTRGGRHALQAWLEGRAQLTHASTHASNAPHANLVGDSVE